MTVHNFARVYLSTRTRTRKCINEPEPAYCFRASLKVTVHLETSPKKKLFYILWCTC